MPTFLERTPHGWRQRLLPTTTTGEGPPGVLVDGVWVGLDLGQAADYSALCVVQRRRDPAVATRDDPSPLPPPPEYHVRHLQRWRLQTPYPDIVRDVVQLMGNPVLGPPGLANLIVDATGVGPPVVDLLLAAGLGKQLVACTITAGNQVSMPAPGEVHAPKRDLVSALSVLLQTQRLKIAPALPEAATLTRELESFQVRISAAGRDTYGAWREGAHDDLVLAVALAVWAGEKGLPGRTRFY
jgi:hypothetical protein